MTSPRPDRTPPGGRRLPYWGFAGVVLVYLAIIQVGGILVSNVADAPEVGGALTTTRDVVLGLWVPLGVALLFVLGVILYLGWGRAVLHDDRPVQRWVRIVPVAFVIAILLATDYGALAQNGLGFTLALLLGTQLVGWGEEGMFRGVGVVMLREHGLSEGKVALWSSIVFGAVHLSNAVGRGLSALPQALIVSLAGYFFYLTRRVSRGNVLNSIVHGLFDFSVLTGTAILANQTAYVGTSAAVLVYVVLVVVLVVRRKNIEPA